MDRFVKTGNKPGPEERHAKGRKQREKLSRESHAHWKPDPHRNSPLDLLAAAARGRLPHLIAIKYERMMASPFGFFRGAVPVMAADLAAMPHASITNQICGDAHVLNLGAYAAPDGRLVFDINDFDETIHAPFEWDVKRLATSLVLAGRQAGVKNKGCSEAVTIFVKTTLMESLAQLPWIELAHYQIHRVAKAQPVTKALQKAQTATPLATLKKLTERGGRGGQARRFRHQPPLLTRLSGGEAGGVLKSLHAYRNSLLPERQHFLDQYKARDVGFKVVGTGSVGLRDYLIFLEGNGTSDPLFLQVKEETASAYAPYLREAHAAKHGGQRVAEGQRAMQYQSDPFLGWTHLAGRNYLVRQLNDHKAAIEIEDLEGGGLNEYAEICGELLARGHARSGDPQVLSGYIGNSDKFADAITDFASAYADQTEKDWKLLVRSRKPATARVAKRSHH